MLRTLITFLILLCPFQATKADDQSELNAILSANDGQIKIVSQQEKTIISIQSERGIGRATLKRTGNAWPKQILLQIHLKGLESLKLATPSTRLSWSVSSHGRATSTSLLHDENKETALSADHPLFAQIKAIPAESTVPLKEKAYFELQLPASLLKPEEAEFELHWIDFYRN